jgi:hypothetical protein
LNFFRPARALVPVLYNRRGGGATRQVSRETLIFKEILSIAALPDSRLTALITQLLFELPPAKSIDSLCYNFKRVFSMHLHERHYHE